MTWAAAGSQVVKYNPKKSRQQRLAGILGSFETRLRVQQDSEFRKSYSEQISSPD